MYCRKEREANAYVENFHFENCKDRYLIMFILRNHLVLEKELIQLSISIHMFHTTLLKCPLKHTNSKRL